VEKVVGRRLTGLSRKVFLRGGVQTWDCIRLDLFSDKFFTVVK
jgi:hypothetical protein